MEPHTWITSAGASNAWWSEVGGGSARMERHRRLLAYDQSGAPPSKICTNSTTGQPYLCVRPEYPVLVIIVAGIVSMVFLVSVALVLLMCSFYKRRGSDQQPPVSQVTPSSAAATDAPPVATASDDLILVYMPGDEPATFARPVLFTKEADDCKSGGEPGHEQGNPAIADKKESQLEVALEVPHIAGGLSMSRQGSFAFQQLSPRHGFRLSRHASFRFEHSAGGVASLLAEARSSSFPRRQSEADSGNSSRSDDWRSNIPGELEHEQASLATGIRSGSQVDTITHTGGLSISSQGTRSSRFHQLLPPSSPRVGLLSNHASFRFEGRRSIASQFDRARSFSLPRTDLAGHPVLENGRTDDRAFLLRRD